MGRRGCLVINICLSMMLLLIVVSCGACWVVDWDNRSRRNTPEICLLDPAPYPVSPAMREQSITLNTLQINVKY